MTRRLVLGGSLAALLLAVAIAPWTVSAERLGRHVTRQLAPYGLRLTASGRTAVALLPVPRIKIGKVEITGRDGEPILSDAQLRGDLDLAALFTGRIVIEEVVLTGGRLTLDIDRHRLPVAGAPLPVRLGAGPRSVGQGGSLHEDGSPREGGSLPRRVTLTGVAADIVERGSGAAVSLSTLDLFVLQPAGGGIAASGAATWRGETIEAALTVSDPAAPRAGRVSSKVELRLTNRLARLSIAGAVEGGERLGFEGRIGAEITSMRGFGEWLAPGSAIAASDRRLGFAGVATIEGRDISWPQIRLDIGEDRLDGALAGRMDPDHAALRATLAADTLDLGWLLPLLPRAVAAARGGTPVAAGLRAATLDLRLSASDLRLHGLRLRDSAASVLAEAGKLDVSLLRATVAGGTLKGRIGTDLGPGADEVRGQASAVGLDAATALAQLSLPPAITGTVAAQATFGIPGGTPDGDVANPLDRLGGRLALTVRRGTIASGGANAARPASAAARLPEPLPFSRLGLDMAFASGIGEVTEGSIESDASAASLHGRVAIPEGSLNLRAVFPPSAGEPDRVILSVEGPWTVPQVATGQGAAPAP